MQAFMILHKPSDKWVTRFFDAATKAQQLRSKSGSVFLSKEGAKNCINSYVDSRWKSEHHKELHNAKVRDFSIKEFVVDLADLAG